MLTIERFNVLAVFHNLRKKPLHYGVIELQIELNHFHVNPSRPVHSWKLYWNKNLTQFFLFVRDWDGKG